MTKCKTYKLGEIARFQTGKLNSNAAKEDGKYPFFTCSPTTLSIDTYAFDKEAILLAGNNAEGNFSIKYYKGKFNAYQRTYVIESIDDKCYLKFLYYALKICLQQFKIMSQGTSTKFLTSVILNNFEISLPSLEEQKRIANILGAIDDKIEINRRINDNLEQQAQALYKQWFVDFDTIKLGDAITTTSGGTPSRKNPEYYDGNYGWVKSKELNCSFIIDTEEKITEQAISKSAAKMLPKKTVLIAMYGATVGQYALLSSSMACNQAVCALLPNENYPYTYLFMFAKNKKEELINKAVGSAQQNISQVLIKDLDISNDILKIKQFHTIVNPFFETIEKNQQEITRLTTLRDTLLPKLMSGDIAIE